MQRTFSNSSSDNVGNYENIIKGNISAALLLYRKLKSKRMLQYIYGNLINTYVKRVYYYAETKIQGGFM